jgi:hypothetical protein
VDRFGRLQEVEEAKGNITRTAELLGWSEAICVENESPGNRAEGVSGWE